ncbi:MAG: hypothetical protein JXR71_13260 [Bacteroidales bacterium]|nr:hypothetical protein [Bacteroidales bacterium]
MKKLLLSFLMLLFSMSVFAQLASVEKSVTGIQAGYLGLWGYNELKLDNELVFRTDLGFDGGVFMGSGLAKTGYLLNPVLSVGIKYYYNLNKRLARGKSIGGNSGDYLMLMSRFHPGGRIVISNYNDLTTSTSVSLSALWGTRQTIGKHFIFETGFGPTYVYNMTLGNSIIERSDKSYFGLAFLLTFGYRF